MSSTNDHDSEVQRRFGASAEHYRTSATHARGQSLSRLLALTKPRADWTVLDVATGAGHTAAFLAPYVETVVAGDLTQKMLEQAGIVIREQRLSNVSLVRESAQSLAYRDDSFDLATCRVAAHHFPAPELFVAECARVLKPGGLLAVIDNIVPDDRTAAEWINDFERQRDPSHARCLSLADWRHSYARHGLIPVHEEVNAKWFDFEEWMRRMKVSETDMERLGRSLLTAPDSVRDFWQPKREEGLIALALQEAIVIGRMAG